MAVAETAQLVVLLQLKDEMSGSVAKAEAQLAGLNRAAAGTGTATTAATAGMSKLGTVTAGVGGALSHAKSQLGGLISGPLGFIGLAAAAGGVGAVIGHSIGKVEEFGASLEKVKTLTGETDLQAGALILTFQKFGLGADKIAQTVGFAEKSLGKLANTAEAKGSSLTKLQAIDQKYGLSLQDSSGKVVSYSELLNQLATFYDSNASASTKAYVASQLLGRGYTTLIPVLNEGSAGLRQAAKDAEALGLGSGDTAKQLAQFHDQMHALENQTNLLQLSIGTALLPELIDLSKAATDFVQSNRAGIVDFFKQGAQFAKDFAGAMGPLVGALGGIVGLWNKLPSELKTLLVGGFVANKALKWTFGISGLDMLKGLGGLGGGLIGRGATPANPVFVSDVAGGLGALGGGEAALIGGGLGTLVAGAAAIVAAYYVPQILAGNQKPAEPKTVTTASGITYGTTATGYMSIDALSQGNPALRGLMEAATTSFDTYSERSGMGARALTVTAGKLDTAADKLISAANIIHNAPLFHQAADVRRATGKTWDFQVLRGFGRGEAGISPQQALTAAMATAIVEQNLLNTPGNDKADLRSAKYELGLILGVQKGLPAGIRHQLDGPIASLRAAINATTQAIKNKTFYLTYTPTGPGTGTARPGDTRSELHVQTTVTSRDVRTATTTSQRNGGSTSTYGNRPAPGAR